MLGGVSFLTVALGLSQNMALLIIVLIVGAYVMMGGMKGVMYTDAFQGGIMVLGMVILLWVTYSGLGGIVPAHEQLTAIADKVPAAMVAKGHRGWTAMPELMSPLWWTLISTVVLGVGIGVLAQPQLVVRFMTVKSDRELNRGVVIGGVFLAFSLASGTAGANGMEVTNPLMVSLNTIGMAGISMMIPVLAAYISYSMAGKPALAPGFVLGYLVNNAVVTPSGNSVSTGFLGAMIMAVICGYFVRWMKTWKVNNTIQTIMPILIIPILTSLVLGMAYIYILATPLGFVMDWLTGVLGSLQGGSAVVLGLVIGVMTAFDMGGPINKTASTFTMAIMASGIYGPNGMFRVAVAVPPIACGLAALIAKNKFDDADRQMGISALFMGCIGITEGAIPFAVKDLGHTLPGICIGSAVGAALAAFQGIDCYVPHGGFIVALATNNVALFCLDIVIGAVVAAAILIAMKPTLDKQAK